MRALRNIYRYENVIGSVTFNDRKAEGDVNAIPSGVDVCFSIAEFHGHQVTCSPVRLTSDTSVCSYTELGGTILSCKDVEVEQRRGSYATAFAELIANLIVTSDKILREEFGTNLRLDLKLAIGIVGQLR